MAGNGGITGRILGAQVRQPKTILGFFAIVLGILAAGAAIVIGALSRVSSLHYLIVPILVFTGVVIIVVLLGVFIIAWKDPTILMLGEVTAEAYVAIRKLSLGDSLRGEKVEEIVVVPETGAIRQLAEPRASDEGT